MSNGPLLSLAASFALLGMTHPAAAGEPLPMARASFPLVTETADPPPARESSLDRLSPKVVAALPLLPGAAPKTAPPQPANHAAPPPARPPTAAQSRPTNAAPEWDVSLFRNHPSTRSLNERQSRGPDQVTPEPSARERDLWMLSIEGVTRAPIDAGLQATFETPVGLRFFGGYGWVPSMYLGRIMGTAAQISSDPVVGAVLENGFDSGKVWRAGVGYRPFRSVGVYLDAGYARVTLRGELNSAELSGVPGLGGSETVDSTLGVGFVELGYQAKIADRVVLALAVGATKVFKADTRVTGSGGAADDPKINEAAAVVDDGLETYGLLPTLTLRLGLDLI